MNIQNKVDLKDEIINFFSENGILSQHFENYEFRDSQLEMALGILKTFENDSHIFIEAPTGVGKSFAYLIPAIYFAKKYNRKAIISTYTINLQEQLIQKDIPLLQKILPTDFKAGLIKGRTNYLCTKRLRNAIEKSNSLFETEEQIVLDTIYAWSKVTKDGTLSDISFPISENIWSSVCSERGICTSKTCGGKNTDCFYQKAKNELSNCDLIIVNHHLFFTLLNGFEKQNTKGYLYNNDFVIFDEGHTLEQVASEHISPALSRESIKFNLLRLYNEKKRKGFLLTLPSLHILPIVQNLLDLNQSFFYELKRKLFIKKGNKLEKLTARVYEKNIVDNILKSELEKLVSALRTLRQTCQDEFQLNELNDYILRFGEFSIIVDSFLNQTNDSSENKFVYWVEISSHKEDANITLASSPVDISNYFQENIFKDNEISVVTSATLTVNKNFNYFKRRLGGYIAHELVLSSPFDFYRQVKIYIPRNINELKNENDLSYQEKLLEWIYYFIKMTNGRALTLFTNSYLMKNIGKELRDLLGEEINILIQGEGISRNILLNKFKTDINSVLFGVDSFWMGIDVPGESLSNLIITKLPFLVPDHPMVQAKTEFINSRGGNSFYEYILPEAILKFRQGIGRLIRNKNDKGIIAILDSRIINKNYGKYFLNSLDECEIEIIE